MKAFDGSEQFKDDLLAQVQASEDAGSIVHGQYGRALGKFNDEGEFVPSSEPWRGCAVGVIVHGSIYDDEDFHGIPGRMLLALEKVYEAQPYVNEDAATYPRRFLEAIPVGADLSSFTAPKGAWCEVCQDYHTASFASFEEFLEAVKAAAAPPVA